jgi:hypothetical protein
MRWVSIGVSAGCVGIDGIFRRLIAFGNNLRDLAFQMRLSFAVKNSEKLKPLKVRLQGESLRHQFR